MMWFHPIPNAAYTDKETIQISINDGILSNHSVEKRLA